MSKAAPRPARRSSARRTFDIVASRFNDHYVRGLIDHATAELRNQAGGPRISIHRVPGAFEIPVVVRELALQNKADAIIACGVILKGETNHAQNLSWSVTDALQRIAVEHGVPVISAVLSFEDERQAQERCLGEKINRGTEAARAAVEIADRMSMLRLKGGGSRSPLTRRSGAKAASAMPKNARRRRDNV